MSRRFTVYFVVLVLTTASANDDVDVGNVIGFAPVGSFKFIFSRHDNDILLDDYKLEEFRIITTDGKYMTIVCHKFLLDPNTNNEEVMLRATLISKENVEVESFRVSECNRKKLAEGITVTTSIDQEERKEYFVWFRDENKTCLRRRYYVKINADVDYIVVSVDRSNPSPVPQSWTWHGWADNCPVQALESVIIGWIENGLIHQYTLDSKHDTIFALDGVECDNCYVMCKQYNDKFFVDLLVARVPIDRVKTTSCDREILELSIKADMFVENEDIIEGIIMNYLGPDGHCHRRIYLYSLEYRPNDNFLEIVYLTREEVQENEKCTLMRYEGYKRYLAKKLQDNIIGRFASQLLSFCGGLAAEEKKASSWFF